MKKLILVVSAGLIILASCKKEEKVAPTPQTPATMDQLQVPSDFQWRTTGEYMLTLSGPVTSLVEAVSESGVVYQRAYIIKGKPLVMKLSLPSYEKVVYIRYLGQNVEIKLTAPALQYMFN